MTKYFDNLETRSSDERAAAIAMELPKVIALAKSLPGYADSLVDTDPSTIQSAVDLVALPVLRKSDLVTRQSAMRPLGGFNAGQPAHMFQSPGPIYEPGNTTQDWWRFGRFLNGLGVGAGDIVQNCFSYHFTPAGMMFESGAHAVGATVMPAGVGQTELQARAMADLGVTTYAGTPDYLKTILEQADSAGLDVSNLKKAAVSGGPLFPQLRSFYQDRGIACLQCYATADLGHIAYETRPDDGMIIDENVIVEIVTPGTGQPVEAGEIGEIVVTNFNADYPMIRMATGDMSAAMAGQSDCGRTNMRIVGWRGRADQATKVKGMFVRPEQVAQFVERFDDVTKARVEVRHDGSNDQMSLMLETASDVGDQFETAAREILKLRADISVHPVGSLPKDGLVIADLREI